MKKIYSLILVAGAMALTGGCSFFAGQPEFEDLVIDTLLRHNNAECRVEYRFASIRNADKSPALKAIETSNIGYFFQTKATETLARKAAQAAIREIGKTMADNGGLQTPAHETIESEGRVADSLVTYIITRSSYMGGAHGIYGTEYHTYRIRDGYELSTIDLFSLKQSEQLEKMILDKLMKTYGAKDEDELAQLGFFPDYIEITENFLIDERGITFHYNPYDIGCYALGSIDVTISHDEWAQL